MFPLAKLTLLSNVKGNAHFQSRWGMTYHKDEPEEIPVHYAISFMTDSDYKIDFESGDLDDLHENRLADIAENLGLERDAKLTAVKKIVFPAKSKAKKVVESVAAMIPKKEETPEEVEEPEVEAPVEEPSEESSEE